MSETPRHDIEAQVRLLGADSLLPPVKRSMPNTPLEIRLFDALKRIGKYMTPEQIRRDAGSKHGPGLDYEEYLEMSYENIQADAKRAVHGLRIKRP